MNKRAFDLTASVTLLVLLSPILFLIAILVFFFLGSPVLFMQSRAGLHGKIFKIIKFRTMKDLRNAEGELLSDRERLTRFGKFLRTSSLDELPELINVLKGEMSLVGPRPLLSEYLSLYNEQQGKRHLVRPGITGLAQIKGRNELTWHDKFRYDLDYVKNQSFWLDIKILFFTLLKVIRRAGISQKGEVTAEKFRGN